MRVVSLGDLVLDVVVQLEQPLALGADASSSIRLSAGGQGANVAAWLAALGGDAAWLGKRATDDAGELAAGKLRKLGVDLLGPVAESGNGVIVSLVGPDGERSMCPDRGIATELHPSELSPELLTCDHLHVSGYSLLAEPVRDAATRAIHLARDHGARISIDLASWSAIRDLGPDRFRTLVESLAPDVVFANVAEDEILGGAIAGPLWIRKLGAAGCEFGDDLRPARPTDRVVDTTGAGDALAAGWILGGPDLALEAAGRCIQHVGAMPVGTCSLGRP